MSIRVRSRGPRRRGSTSSLVRTNPKGIRRFPPSPWIGEISRFCKPTLQSDYLSLATDSWSTGHYYDCWKPFPSPTFGGDLWTCRYYLLAPPASSANGAETSVILPPVRLTVSEPAANNDPMVTWDFFPASDFRASIDSFFGMQTFAQNTWLPVSGNSHISAGKPTWILPGNIFSMLPDAANQLLAWAGNTSFLNYPFPNNWHVAAKYMQFRKNGSTYGTLINNTTRITRDDDSGTRNPNRLAVGYNTPPVSFPSNPVTFTFPLNEQESWEFEFTAGDTIEVDLWYEAKIKNNGIPETQELLVIYPETNDTYSDRIGTNHTGSGWAVTGLSQIDRACQIKVVGLKVSYGFDPSIHTYSFTPSDGTFSLGTARSPAMAFDVDSKHLAWRYDISTPATGGVAYTTTVFTFGGSKNTRWEFSSVSVGASVTVRFAAGGPTFSYVSTTTDPDTFVAALKVELDAFIAARSGDPYWGTATTSIPPANHNVLLISYGTALTLLVTGTTMTPPTSRYVDLYLHFDFEMAWIELSRSDIFGSAFYRPQSSGDYVNQVFDEFQGTLNSGPTGVFNHMGTTVFELWRGSQAGTYDGRGALPSDFPSSITVALTTQ